VAASRNGRGFTPVADSDAFQLGRDTAGSALGLGAIKFWSRDKFHGANALKRHINPTRSRSSKRRAFVGWKTSSSRRSCSAHLNAAFISATGERYMGAVLRCPTNCTRISSPHLCRPSGRGWKHHGWRSLEALRAARPTFDRSAQRRGKLEKASLELRFQRILIHPPKGKQKNYPELILTAIHAKEIKAPKGRERIDWKLLTDLPVRSCLDASKDRVVRAKMEDRDLSQNPQVRMPRRTSKAENGRAAGKLDRHPLHPQLAHLLDHDVKPDHA